MSRRLLKGVKIAAGLFALGATAGALYLSDSYKTYADNVRARPQLEGLSTMLVNEEENSHYAAMFDMDYTRPSLMGFINNLRGRGYRSVPDAVAISPVSLMEEATVHRELNGVVDALTYQQGLALGIIPKDKVNLLITPRLEEELKKNPILASSFREIFSKIYRFRMRTASPEEQKIMEQRGGYYRLFK